MGFITGEYLDVSLVVEANPSVVHFAGFEVGTKQKQTVLIRNVTADTCRIHLIKPETRFFKVCLVTVIHDQPAGAVLSLQSHWHNLSLCYDKARAAHAIDGPILTAIRLQVLTCALV